MRAAKVPWLMTQKKSTGCRRVIDVWLLPMETKAVPMSTAITIVWQGKEIRGWGGNIIKIRRPSGSSRGREEGRAGQRRHADCRRVCIAEHFYGAGVRRRTVPASERDLEKGNEGRAEEEEEEEEQEDAPPEGVPARSARRA